jgi:aspartyl-tRNA(Asn)/glutamyl-tRNA(Gln) amidotransferase subunit C
MWIFFMRYCKLIRMSISSEDVTRLADLARLALTDDETARAEKELEAILDYVDRLQKIDTSSVLPQTMPAKETGWRHDVALECDELGRELILSNFPTRNGDLLDVPAVFDKPKK